MPQYLPLPNGQLVPVKEGQDPEAVWTWAQQQYPEAFGVKPTGEQPQGGFTPALKAGFQRLVGQGALTAGKAGLIDTQRAEQIAQEREARAKQIHAPTQESFFDAPLTYTAEMLGGSLPYAVAPLAIGAGAAALGAPAAVVAGAAGLASLAQSTGANLERAMGAQGKPLADVSGGAAVAAAVPQAALDVVGFRFVPGIGKLFGAAGEKVTADTARQLASQTAGKILADYAAATGKTMTAEGLTEAMQQVLERAQAGLATTDPEARGEYLQSFFGGALLGGVMALPGRAVERSQMKSKSQQMATEQQRQQREQAAQAQAAQEQAAAQAAAQEQAAAQAAAQQQTSEEQAAAEAERDAPAQTQPFFQSPQGTIPGVEPAAAGVAPVVPPTPEQARVQGSQLLEERRVLEQRLQEYQGALGEANAAKDFDGAQQLLERFQRTQASITGIDAELKRLGVQDTEGAAQDVAKQIEKIERKLAAQTGPGVDPAVVAKLLSQRKQLQEQLRAAGGQQTTLDLGAPQPLTDPSDNYQQYQHQQAAQEFAGRDALLRQQEPAERDASMDLFQESTDQVEDVRQNGESNFDYLDPLFEKAFAGGERAVAVPDNIQPTPNAGQMIARLDALEQQSKTGAPEQRAQALQEMAQLSGADAAPAVQALRAARLGQERALMDLQATLDDLRKGVDMGGPRSAEASSLRSGLYRQLAKQRAAFIRSMLDEAAVQRRMEGAPALTRDQAMRAAEQADRIFEEWANRTTAQRAGAPALLVRNRAREAQETGNLRRAVGRAVEQVRRAQQDLAAATDDAGKVAAERVLAARQLDLEQAKRTLTDAPKRLVQGERMLAFGDARDLVERPLGAPRAAQDVFTEQLAEVQRGLKEVRPPARADRQLLRRQDATVEAARTAEAAGDTANTPAGRDRREQDFVAQQLGSLEQRGIGVGMLRAALEQHPTRAVRAAVRAIVERMDLGQQAEPALRRQLAEAVRVATAVQVDHSGQMGIFDNAPGAAEQQQLSRRRLELQAELAQIPQRFKNGRVAAAALERSNILQRALVQLERRIEQAGENVSAAAAEAARLRSDVAFTRASPENFRRALDSSPEVKRARAALERFQQAAQRGFASPDRQPTSALAQQLRTPAAVADTSWANTPALQAAQAAVDRQRALLVDAKKQAVVAAVEADQKARDIAYGPQLRALQQQIKDATTELDKLRSWPFAESAEAADATAPVQQLQKELRGAQRRLGRLAQDAVAQADSTMVRYAIAEDAVVQFEKALLVDMEVALQNAINDANPSVIEQRRLAAAAQAQRERVAVEEATQRKVADTAAKNKREFETRLRGGFGLPALRPGDRVAQQELRRRIAALDTAIAAPDQKVAATQAQLVELQSQPDPTRQIKRKIYDVSKRLEREQDAAGAVKERLEQQREALLTQLEGHEYLTEQDRRDAEWRERIDRERGTALDMLAAQPFAARARATSPVYRESSREPRSLRTGSVESMAGDNTPAPKGMRARESRKPLERNVEITSNEMQIANAQAAALKAMSPKDRARQVAEVEAVAKEMQKQQRTSPVRRSRVAEAIKDIDIDMDETFDAGFEDLGGVLREDQNFYTNRERTEVSEEAAEAAFDGRTLDLLAELASTGSTDHVRSLSAALRPLLMRTKIVVADGPIVYQGAVAEGMYSPSTNTVTLSSMHLTEEAILHELTHAATMRALEGDVTLTPSQQQAVDDLRELLARVRENPAIVAKHGLGGTDAAGLREFVSELQASRELRDAIDALPQGLLRRIFNAILRLVGARVPTQSARAVEQAYELFAPSRSFAFRPDGVKAVLRGVFPATAAEFNADIPQRVRDMTARTVGRDLTLVDKLQAHIAGFRTAYIDRFDSIDRALRQGVDRGLIPQLQAFQTQYFLRFGEHRNQFVEQAASNGVPQLIKHADGTFTIETPAGEHANLAKIATLLHGANVGNEQATEQLFTQYLAVLRAEQDGVGYEKLNFGAPLTAADAAEIKRTITADPARKQSFEAARAVYREYNHKLLDFLQQTDALSKDEVARLKSKEYVPYYRNRGGVVELVVGSERPVRIGNIVDQPYLKELVGDDAKILPFFTGALQNTSMLIDMALRNQQTKDVAMTLHRMGVSTIGSGDGPTDVRDIVRFKIDGEPKFARIENSIEEFGVNAELLVQGMSGIKTTLPAFLTALQIPANWLRKAVTRAPAYAVRQIIREPINAWLTSGGNFTPVVSSVKELASMVRGTSEKELQLQRAGAISSNVITGDIQDQVRILRDISGGKTTFDKVMSVADKFAMQGDAATRAVLYDTYRKQGMTHMQALLGSLESMNFARRGVSPSMQMMSQLVPFFNAQVQGMDVIYRALRGRAPLERQLDVRRKLLKRGLMVSAATMAYAAAMQDDEAYKNATPEQRALNWFLPLPGLDEPLRVPIPFELGYLFKVLPETVVNVAAGDQDAGDAVKLYAGLLHQTVPFGVPQAVKPAIEVMTNHSFFTGEAVETGRERSMQKSERARESTTELAKMLGGTGLMSPIQIDYLIRGYTGGLGIAVASIPNFALRPLNSQDSPELPEKTLSQLPLLGPLFQPRDGRAAINAAYDEIEGWQQAHNTFQNLLASGRRADAAKFAQDYSRDIALNSVGGAFKQQMGELAKLRRAVTAGPGTPESKRQQIDAIKQVEIRLARKIAELGEKA